MKSVITCDLEGRIETFNGGAAALFGYAPEEVIGKLRVSVFSPGLIVLGHVGRWLERAAREGHFETRTVFKRRDGSLFAADIRLTPTRKDGEHVGFCGVTAPCPDVDPATVMPPVSFGTRLLSWLVITRAPFLTATLVSVLVGAASVFARRGAGAFPWGLAGLALVGALALHVAANVFNDYFDWKSGTDQANNAYFQPFSGGSRAVELGLVTLRGQLLIATTALLVAGAAAAALVWLSTAQILLFGLAGAFSGFFYTAPPLRLAARRGLGELFVGLNFGPLLVAGTVCALEGGLDVDMLGAAALLGLPLGLLTTAILWVNEFPDAPSDAATGKRHLVVVLGTRRARVGYALILAAAAAVLIGGAATGALPLGALAMLAVAPLGVSAAVIVWRHFQDRSLVRASAATVKLQLLAGLLLAVGLVVEAPLRAWL